MRDRAFSLAAYQPLSLHEECGVAPIVLKKRGELGFQRNSASSSWNYQRPAVLAQARNQGETKREQLSRVFLDSSSLRFVSWPASSSRIPLLIGGRPKRHEVGLEANPARDLAWGPGERWICESANPRRGHWSN